MAEKAVGAHDPARESAEERDARRKALARQIEEQVQRLSLIHDDLQKLVGQLREDEDEEHG
jgi:3-methyladenine DNA glycosylase/8-oxoguanine DNA glycosylase